MYQRVWQVPPVSGGFRIARDVVLLQRGDPTDGITVLSDAPVIVGEQMTLTLVSAEGDTELKVIAVASRPHIVEGAMRHVIQLALAPTTSRPDEELTDGDRRI
jgi:hypothetical protein